MKKLVFIGLLSFLLAAIWQFPLSVAKPYIEKTVKQLKLEGANGSLWHGSVRHLFVNNKDLGNVNWKVKPFKSLISFSLKSSFEIKGKELSADGIAAITPSKKIILDNTNFNVNAAYFNSFQKQAKLSGEFFGNINRAEVETSSEDKILPILDAIIDWKQGAVSSLLLKLEAGDYHFIVTPEDEGLLIKPSSKDAPLDLNGEITLNKDWVLRPNIKVGSSNQGIAGMLNLAGKPQNDGTTLITKSTDLKPFLKTK